MTWVSSSVFFQLCLLITRINSLYKEVSLLKPVHIEYPEMCQLRNATEKDDIVCATRCNQNTACAGFAFSSHTKSCFLGTKCDQKYFYPLPRENTTYWKTVDMTRDTTEECHFQKIMKYGNTVWWRNSKGCYQAYLWLYNWNDARIKCLGQKGDLAVLKEDSTILSFNYCLKKSLGFKHTSMWLGSSVLKDHPVTWVDDSTILEGATNVQTGFPYLTNANNCLAVDLSDSNLNWYFTDCEQKNSFVCERVLQYPPRNISNGCFGDIFDFDLKSNFQ